MMNEETRQAATRPTGEENTPTVVQTEFKIGSDGTEPAKENKSE